MKATREAYGEALLELGQTDHRVVVLDADLSKSTYSFKFAEAFPERFFNMGVAEADLIGTAAGLAAAGKIPFASTFAVFATGRVYDQIRNSVAYSNLNVKIAGSHSGITVGEDGASHQALEDISLMRSLPGLTVIVPADAPEAYRATLAAAAREGPIYLRLGRPKVPDVLPSGTPFQIGRGILLERGRDICLVTTGSMTAVALQAARILSASKIYPAVIHLSTIKPLDREMIIEQAGRTGAVITIEEHSIIGGLGSAVAEVLGENLPTPMKRLGMEDCFGQSGAPEALLEFYGLTPSRVAAAAGEMVKKKYA